MLVHCCCFVVNSVRGSSAGRLLDALSPLCQLSPPPPSKTRSTTFYSSRSTDICVHRGMFHMRINYPVKISITVNVMLTSVLKCDEEAELL
ncbi:Aquaporin-3 [Dissostichus eleginoides]|uniref:Aquaporin-3 n=1 Tax=Dissostichus eleginoides TaxID=100907 RepID=A0AAD9EQ41_DISEL|nr:Aquaporin-3 [Dissostichus eleginoides]